MPAEKTAIPIQIGRYRVIDVLGEGSFSCIYLAHDDELDRPVAIKLPHRERVSSPEAMESYLGEARILAGLDHPNIVPVHDVGRTDDGLCFVVSKLIEGQNLAAQLKSKQPSYAESVRLVAIIAEALHYSHRHGLVHRDIKPANILIDSGGVPFVADFGLALREQDFGKGSKRPGTPAYMSPEQARREGHRVDGRSDIFSLGTVFYEMLTGKLPFLGESPAELFELIISVEPRPPRQYDDSIPKELERICLKALTKRATDRYTTAKDMADDLHFFQGEGLAKPTPTERHVVAEPGPAKIVPKGLRSFDANDAGFFLELLPGPRDRDGLPENLRFWKTRIEEMDADATFAVGLMYGPSGCGKSSLVKAGLLPRLANHVVSIYVEAASTETEARVLKGLAKHCPSISPELDLTDAVAALRRGALQGKKVLLILDQFEQWLHANKGDENAPIVNALRQCDGEHVQCLLMVRDDFWLATSRFLREVEVPIVEAQNSALVDLFDPFHARKVLAGFGRAFGRLPERLNQEHEAFLEQAVEGLAQDGKVISVRLALFAEMVKGKSWTPATLKQIGGAQGVGVAFLDESLSDRSANPKHRQHQRATRAVLQALLPEQGSDIKKSMLPKQELLERSGYRDRPRDFEEVLQILTSELRLITPTDPEGVDENTKHAGGYYQFTHDYLISAVREWLNRKQRETRRGRAELRLQERAAFWNARPERRQLPSLLETVGILLWTRAWLWNEPQRRMMRQAAWYWTRTVLVAIGITATLGIGAYEWGSWYDATVQVDALMSTEVEDVPEVVEEMEPVRRWADPLLRQAYDDARTSGDDDEMLRAAIALVRADNRYVDYLFQRMLVAEPEEVLLIRQFLKDHESRLKHELWQAVERPTSRSQLLCAAAALAYFDPDNQQWKKSSPAIVDELVTVNAIFLGDWMAALQPVHAKLIEPLVAIYRDPERRSSDRKLAATILAEAADDQPKVLIDLLLDGEEQQFVVIFPKVAAHAEFGKWLELELEKKPEANWPDARKEILAKRQANAGVALIRLGRPDKVMPWLRFRPDPRTRSYLIHRLAPLQADAKTILSMLKSEPENSIRQALLLAIGGYPPAQLPTADLAPQVLEWYRSDPDPGVHGAAEWLLRHWGKSNEIEKIDKHLATTRREKGRWYVNGQGQTMVIVPGPVEFMMGSPPIESGREGGPEGKIEQQHQRRIDRSFALASKQVTARQFLRFRKNHDYDRHYSRTLDCPVNHVNWYDAAAYCNWLSEQEGIPKDQWCYEPNEKGKYAEGMKAKPNYLSLQGYRLPTEAEWEFACRAGSITSRYYGETVELLSHYAWYSKNSRDSQVLPVGSLKPNSLGLFESYGNVLEWCHDRYLPYPAGDAVSEDREQQGAIIDRDLRVLRGGSFYHLFVTVRSASRFWFTPPDRLHYVGFRPARTIRSKD